MIIVLNGPLGIGKSTLAEALAESIDRCVMLDGDHLVATNPPADDEREHLHSTIALLVGHHRRFGYRHYVIDHLIQAQPIDNENEPRRGSASGLVSSWSPSNGAPLSSARWPACWGSRGTAPCTTRSSRGREPFRR